MTDHAGVLLREWRTRRRLSQLDLAHRAGVSSRHVSFVETGRSRPTSEMILRLCHHLAVPLREQNRCLLAAGHAPAHPEHRLDAAPMAEVAEAIESILTAHLPHPALVVDRGWDLVAANDAVYALLDGIAPRLLEPPVNVVRATLDPEGLAPRIENLDEWRTQMAARLRRDFDADRDPLVGQLLAEVEADVRPVRPVRPAPTILVPLRVRLDEPGSPVLAFVSTSTVFGTPREVTVSELAIELFYPADDATREALRGG